MKERELGNTNMEDLKVNVADVQTIGNPGNWVTISKAWSKAQGFMKSTKAMSLADGRITLVQTETMQRNLDGSFAISQALVDIPLSAYELFGDAWPKIEQVKK